MNESENEQAAPGDRGTLHIKRFRQSEIRWLKVRAAVNGRTMLKELEVIFDTIRQLDEAAKNGR